VSKLSETHTDATSFGLNFINVPDSLILDKASNTNVNITVRASGFQFLGLQFGSHRLEISLNEVRHGSTGYFLPRHLFLSQIQRQLPSSVDLLEVDGDTLYIDFLKVQTKKVPVVGDISLDLGHNHLLEGRIKLQPDSITLRGPGSEIDTINEVVTKPVRLKNVTEGFEVQATLRNPGTLKYTSYSDSTIRMSAKVFRFSERIIEVPVTVINLPEGTEIKTFPASIPVLCKARIDRLKNLKANDFRITADYDSLEKSQSYLEVRLDQIPKLLHSAELLKERIEFILKRE